jgi:hypothetical protein
MTPPPSPPSVRRLDFVQISGGVGYFFEALDDVAVANTVGQGGQLLDVSNSISIFYI